MNIQYFLFIFEKKIAPKTNIVLGANNGTSVILFLQN